MNLKNFLVSFWIMLPFAWPELLPKRNNIQLRMVNYFLTILEEHNEMHRLFRIIRCRLKLRLSRDCSCGVTRASETRQKRLNESKKRCWKLSENFSSYTTSWISIRLHCSYTRDDSRLWHCSRNIQRTCRELLWVKCLVWYFPQKA